MTSVHNLEKRKENSSDSEKRFYYYMFVFFHYYVQSTLEVTLAYYATSYIFLAVYNKAPIRKKASVVSNGKTKIVLSQAHS